MSLEHIINYPTIDGRAPLIIKLGKQLEMIEAGIKRLKEELTFLEDKDRNFAIKLDQIGCSLTVNIDQELTAELRKTAIQSYKNRISNLQTVHRNLCRTNPENKTNGEVWAEEREDKK